MKQFYLGSILLSLFFYNFSVKAQTITTATYPFTTSSGESMIDMSSGTTSLVGSSSDDGVSTVQDIGFDFWFVGTRYTQFSANANGLVRLGGTVIDGAFTNSLASTTDNPKIAPYWDDLATGSVAGGGNVSYKVTGSPPNRILVIQWFVTVPRNTTGAANATFQLWLSETSGKIEFVYGNGMATNSTNSGASIGFIASGTTVFSSVTLNATSTSSTCAYGTANNANTIAISSGTKFTFTPLTPAAPTSLTFSGITTTGMTLNWVDNSTNEYNYDIWMSYDGINYDRVTSVSGTTYSYNATGLNCGSTYYWKVYAVSEGGFSSELSGSQATISPPVPGTYTVGPTGNYSSITNAIAAISCASYITGSYIFELQSTYVSTVETFPLTIGNIGGTNVNNTITIRPVTGATSLSITSSNATATINFNGAKFITIDGRPGGSGTSELTIANTNTAGNAILYINEASLNNINYCSITGVNASATNGVIQFSTTTGTAGNDYNVIDNCNISKGTTYPANLIYSKGTAGIANDNITISNCNLFDFYSNTVDHAAIFMDSDNSDWIITGNSIYQTASVTSVAFGCRGINFSTTNTGINYNISNNYIGGNGPNATGTWTVTGTPAAYFFRAITQYSGINGTSYIQNNTIKGFTWISSSNSTGGSGVWCGISVAAGDVTVNGNTIGATTGTGSITIQTSSATTALSLGINSISTGIVTISNNTIGSITITNSTANSHSFKGIQASGASGTLTISGNLIGSTSTSNSINCSTASTETANPQKLAGISSSHAGIVSITGNTISNINNAYATAPSAATNVLVGIETTAGVNTISSNIIYNLFSANAGAGTYSSSTVIGILHSSTGGLASIDHNLIYTLENSTATANISISGIYFTGSTTSTHKITHNKIYALSTSSSGVSVQVVGICYDGGTSDYVNNIIRLGIDASGASQTSSFNLNGILHNATTTTNIYYNSVYIGGSGVSTASVRNTRCFRRETTSGTLIIKNNIFYNARSNSGGGGGAHYGISVAGTASVTCNYNDIYISGTGGCVSNAGAGCTFANWQGLGFDANGISVDPGFINPIGTAITTDLHINPSNCNLTDKGTPITGFTTDIDDEIRSLVTPDIGADEFGGSILNAGTVAACTGLSTSITLSGFGSASIQWQESASNSPYSWSSVSGGSGATTATYTTPNLASTKYYRAAITNGTCTTYSNEVAVSISPGVPGNPGTVSGNDYPCLNTTQTYSIAAVTGTNLTYNWTVPSGTTITSGTGTNSITVRIGSNSGNVSVNVTNPCGTTTTTVFPITVGGSGTWTGTVNTKWSVSANWCGNAVPKATTDVVIPSAPVNQPIIDNSLVYGNCKDLIINSGARLTVRNDLNCNSNGIGWGSMGTGYLIVYGNLVNNGTMYHSGPNTNRKCLAYNLLAGNGTISGSGSYLIEAPYDVYFQGDVWGITNNATYSLSVNWPPVTSELFQSVYIDGTGTLSLNANTLKTNGWSQYGNFNSNTGTLNLKGIYSPYGLSSYSITPAKSTWGTNSNLIVNITGASIAWSDQDDYFNVEYKPSIGNYYRRNADLTGANTINGFFKITDGEVRGDDNVTPRILNLKGDWINNGTFTANLSTIGFTGTSTQRITTTTATSTTFKNLTINNSKNIDAIVLDINTNVNGVLTMTNGDINSTATERLTLNSTATVSPSSAAGSGSSASFVSGYLDRITSTTSGTVYDFPMGNSATGLWRPLAITTKDVTSRTWTVQMVNADPVATYNSTIKSGEILTGINTNYYYDISRLPATGNIDLKCWYGESDQTYAESDLMLGHWDSGNNWWDNWSKNADSDWSRDATNNWVQALNVGTFSPVAPGGKGTPLPITLLNFEAKAIEDYVDLNWTTSSEINNDYYTVERSADGRLFKEIGIVKGVGNASRKSSYHLVDANPLQGISYYRLMQTDFDGEFTHSDIKAVEFKSLEMVSVNPNPANSSVNISFYSKFEAEVVIKIIDAKGKEVLKGNYKTIGGFNKQVIDISSFASGIYFVSIINEKGNVFKTKLIRE